MKQSRAERIAAEAAARKAHIAAIVAAAPPISDEARAKVAALLYPHWLKIVAARREAEESAQSDNVTPIRKAS